MANVTCRRVWCREMGSLVLFGGLLVIRVRMMTTTVTIIPVKTISIMPIITMIIIIMTKSCHNN